MRIQERLPIQRLRYISTFILLSGFVLYAPIVFYGASINAFGFSQNASIPGVLLITAVIFLIPTLGIWWPYKALLTLGGLCLLLPLYFCLIFLINGEFVAILAIPLVVWYYTGYHLWQNPDPDGENGS